MAYDPHSEAAYKHDPAMEDETMHTITASSAQMSGLRQNSGEHRPQTSYSEGAAFARPYHSAENTPDAQYR